MTGVVQRKYGTKYVGWRHPLSPYYRQKPGAELLPVHPKPGKISYRNWLGLAFGQEGETRTVAASVHRFHTLSNAPPPELRVGGWAMDNMKPLDFDLHIYPTFRFDDRTTERRVGALVEAANGAAVALMRALKKAVAMKGQAAEAVREAFFSNTETRFIAAIKLVAGARGREIEEDWLNTLRRTAMTLFDRYAVPALPDRILDDIKTVVAARRTLLYAFEKPMGIRNVLELSGGEKETDV